MPYKEKKQLYAKDARPLPGVLALWIPLVALRGGPMRTLNR